MHFFTKTLSPKTLAVGLMIVCSVLISFGGLIMRNIEYGDAWQINFYRAISLTTAISIILAFKYRQGVIKKVTEIGFPGLLGGAILSIAGISFIQALSHTTVANTLFTMSAIPFITAALGRVFLKEKLSFLTFVAMIVAGFGITIMLAEAIELGANYGFFMALVTAICFSSFTIIVRQNRGVDMLPTLLVSGIIIGSVSFLMRVENLAIPFNDILLCILWGGGLSGFANWAFIMATRHLVAAEVTLFMLLEFSLGPLWVWVLFGENPTLGTLLGGTLVICSVLSLAFFELKYSKRKLKRGRPSPI